MAGDLYIGLISGTSLDAIDAALVEFTPNPVLLAAHSEPIPPALKQTLFKFIQPEFNELDRLGQADVELGYCFAHAIAQLLHKAQLKSADICAIGSHGQNVRHRPNLTPPFTLQIADPNIIVAETGIATVADFRRADLAQGGQGAPLAPLFHREFMKSTQKNRAIVNIGGIANVTLLAKDNDSILGFDTGPGNGLLDAWIKQHKNLDYDANGQWARSGKINPRLLEKLLADPYFQKSPPKSTGKEHFNLDWLSAAVTHEQPEDVQATLTELTAQTIVNAIATQQWSAGEMIIYGGGVHNIFLLERLATLAPHYTLLPSDKVGIAPDWLEAMLFAWLAKLRIEKTPVDTRAITGARQPVILGGLYLP
jgi:anhydro-N-acetylmuramic acid kinase